MKIILQTLPFHIKCLVCSEGSVLVIQLRKYEVFSDFDMRVGPVVQFADATVV